MSEQNKKKVNQNLQFLWEILGDLSEFFLMLTEELAGLLWPQVCPFCGKISASGPCTGCILRLNGLRIREPMCMRCGKQIRDHTQEYCFDCMRKNHAFDRGRSLWMHKEPVKYSVYQFKYHNQRQTGLFYAQAMIRHLGDEIEAWKPDLIMPIPLHWMRRRKRGYNQAGILAHLLGEYYGIPVDRTSMYRTTGTDPQKILNPVQRKLNMRHVFELRNSFQPVDSVLLIDDIYTTGNTLDTAAALLKRSGVRKVYFLTVSIGQGM